ncbi:MAG: DNA helicase RecQ [bacterium]
MASGVEAAGRVRAGVGQDPREVLRTVFGFAEFRDHQEDIVRHVAGGGDALVLMPTGSGKSLCYQIPAIVRPGLGLVVSPLIALMHDQVEALRQLGVRAACLHSGLEEHETRRVLAATHAGELDLLYVAPERLLTDRFLARLGELPLALFAIDEAHCVSQWGHDFRPEYLQLSILHERWPDVPRIALTATADPPTRREIAQKLALEDARQFVAGFDRPNIRYRVEPKADPRRRLLRLVREEHPGDSGIVYCLSRRRTEEVAELLVSEGVRALPYHAGLDADVRRRNQESFVNDETLVMVATVAFGMGIDKPDVRFVCHHDPPKSLEAYYQETGRAGRDGLPATATMTWGLADVALLRKLIDEGADEARRRVEHHKLSALLGYCETPRCRRQVLLDYFGDALPRPCGNCDNCLQPPEVWDGTEAAQKVLSAVVRTDQIFGQAYLIDVLLGHETERLRRFGHHRLPTFGVGRDREKHEWQSVIRQLVAAGLLAVDVDGHGGLRLAGSARDVLRGEVPVELRREPPPARRVRGAKAAKDRAAKSGTVLSLADGDRGLFEALRAKRLELARAQAVPPYVVFADRTLLEIAARRPASLAQLALVHGIGQSKLQRYGEIVLEVVREAIAPAAADAGLPD